MMKNITLALSIVVISILLAGCKSETSLVEESAMGYLTAMGNYKISEAEPYATEETIENTLHAIEKYIMPNLDPSVIQQNTPATIEITDVVIINDTTAEVSYKKTTPSQVQEGKLDMVKRGNEWKAQVRIEIPETLKISSEVDAKALDEKYKGKLKVVPADSMPPRHSRVRE